ncbi:MAG: BamA/TamA family outer membrane protein, partial [Spirochaetia bacterium]
SPIKQTIGFNYQQPWLFDKPWAGGVSLTFDHELLQNVLQDLMPPVFTDSQYAIAAPDPYSNRTDYLNDIANGVVIPAQYLMSYDMYDITLGLNTGYTWTYPFGRLTLQGGYTPQVRYVDYDASLYRPYDWIVRDNNLNWNFVNKISAGINLDGRDIYWNPTTGYYLAQGFAVAGGVLLGQRAYIRSDTTAEGFLTLLNVPVFEGWNLQFVLAAHSSMSMILPNYGYSTVDGRWEWETVADYTDQLYIDGMTVARGWGTMYGDALWDNKLELRMPIAKEVLWLVGFVDAAGLWDQPFGATPPATSIDTMSLNDFFMSTGFGIRFSIPQFPIRLYLARDFQIRDGSWVWRPISPGDIVLGSFNFRFVISLGGNVF